MIALEIKTDPLKVLSSTKELVEEARFVKIGVLDGFTQKVKERIDRGLPRRDTEFTVFGNYEKDVQSVFLENVVNFCFWAEKGKEKWEVKFEGKKNDGSIALRTVFDRALAENRPMLNPQYLAELSLKEVKEIFRSANTAEIPLIEKRLENLVEAGKVLLQKYDGQYLNLMEESNFDAVGITKNTVENFSSFDDSWGKYHFYKRAQLNAFDVAMVQGKEVKNTDLLTAMSDYKLPQVLRHYGAIEYSPELAEKVDNYVLIDQGSREELEIRAATIWATQIIAENLNISAGLADRAIWWLSREEKISQPYHRTYSIYY